MLDWKRKVQCLEGMKRPKSQRDPNRLAKNVKDVARRETYKSTEEKDKNPHVVALSRCEGKKGAKCV